MNQAVLPAQTMRLERLLPGPIERVWEYLTRPDLQRTWLAESASEFRGVMRCQPHRRIEFALRDASVVSMELEPRGAEVRLVLTHKRKVPAWVAGAGTVIAVALLAFSFSRPDAPAHMRQPLGLEMTQSKPQLKFPSSRVRALYDMLGGRC